MKKYYLNAFSIESNDSMIECKTLVKRSFDSITPALRSFYYSVGSLSSSLSDCMVCSLDDESFIKKVRISNRESAIMVYLQKLS